MNTCILRCVLKAPKYEYKNSEFGCFDFLTLRVQLVFVNNRERVYFEQQILTLLLVHPTTNLSRIKFAHIWPITTCVTICDYHEEKKNNKTKKTIKQKKNKLVPISNADCFASA